VHASSSVALPPELPLLSVLGSPVVVVVVVVVLEPLSSVVSSPLELDDASSVVLDDVDGVLVDPLLVSIPVDDSGSIGASSPHPTASTRVEIKPSLVMHR
jgi:hypothetical protein